MKQHPPLTPKELSELKQRLERKHKKDASLTRRRSTRHLEQEPVGKLTHPDELTVRRDRKDEDA